MLSRYSFYEFRPTEEKDLFVDKGCIGLPYFVLTRMRGRAKVSCVCNTVHPWLGDMVRVFRLYHRSAGRLLFTHRERGF